jgi:hypothetical protein
VEFTNLHSSKFAKVGLIVIGITVDSTTLIFCALPNFPIFDVPFHLHQL